MDTQQSKKKDLYDFPIDSILTSDEWNKLRYLIEEELKRLEGHEEIKSEYLPFISYFEDKTREMLINVGFKKEIIEDPEELNTLITILNNQGIKHSFHRSDLHLPYEFPSGTYKVSEDNHTICINVSIEAALRALGSTKILKGLLIKNGYINKDVVRVFLRSLEMIMNLARTGNIAGFAKSKEEAETNSEKTREIKMRIVRRAISQIFEVKPETQKTLGDVWKEFDAVNKGVKFKLRQSDIYRLGSGIYKAEKGKDKNGDDVICIFKDDELFSDYAKRSLQYFIEELK